MDVRHPLRVITPTLDGDVLTHLAQVEAAFTPGQLARLLPKASVEGVRKVLNRLAEQGLVTATRVGNAAITYELNREHVGAGAVIALATQALEVRRRIEHALEGWSAQPVYAALFGSWARGQATVGSDVDLFLVRPDDASDEVWSAQVDQLVQSITRWTGNDTRPFVIDEAEVARRGSDSVLESIVHEGLTMHGEPSWLRRQVKLGRAARNKTST